MSLSIEVVDHARLSVEDLSGLQRLFDSEYFSDFGRRDPDLLDGRDVWFRLVPPKLSSLAPAVCWSLVKPGLRMLASIYEASRQIDDCPRAG